MSNELSRRAMIGSGLAAVSLAALFGVREILQAVKSAESSAPDELHAFLDAYADTLIPATDTPGAKSAGAPAFAELMASHNPDPKDVAEFREKLGLIRAELNQRAGAPFEGLDAAKRGEVLETFDRDVMTGATGQAYRKVYGDLKAVMIYG